MAAPEVSASGGCLTAKTITRTGVCQHRRVGVTAPVMAAALATLTPVPADRSVLLVTSTPGQPTCEEYARAAAAGDRPRKDYVELARRLGDADVIDRHWMRTRASPIARLLSKRAGLPAGQILEGFLGQHRYGHMVAWADRLGLPLALLFKVARSRRDLVLISVWLSEPKKAFFAERLRVYSHLAMIVTRDVQAKIADERLGVPPAKLHVQPRAVDDLFWQPSSMPPRPMICAAGWEARDYPTLLAAVSDLEVDLELAVGSLALPEMARGGHVDQTLASLDASAANVQAGERTPRELRRLYAEARFVVVPLLDVEFDAGVTTITEAMAMGKAVIATRTRGFGDLFQDGVEGLLVAPRNPRALREAVVRLLEHPEEAERMGHAGRRLVERRHRMDPILDELAAITRGERVGAPPS